MRPAHRRHPGLERQVVLILGAFVLNLGTGCASIKDSPVWPSYERPFCYPKASFNREHRRYFGGVSCRF